MEELIETYKAYIVVLGNELDDVVPLAAIHGWQSKRVEEGKLLRERIKQLEAKYYGRQETK